MGLVDWRLDSQGWSVGWRFVEQWNFRRLLCSSGFDIQRWSFTPRMRHLFRLSQRFCSGRRCFVDFRRFVPYLVGQLSRLALIEIQWIPLYRMAQLLLQIVDLVINHIKGIRLKWILDYLPGCHSQIVPILLLPPLNIQILRGKYFLSLWAMHILHGEIRLHFIMVAWSLSLNQWWWYWTPLFWTSQWVVHWVVDLTCHYNGNFWW